MKVVASRLLVENSLFRVTEDIAVDPDGFEIKRAIVHHNGSAVVMPVDEKRRILLVRQYRLPAQQHVWELPAGKIDPGETALQAARRELREETGLRAKRLLKIASYYASPGFLAEKMNLFLATGLTQGESQPMDDERIVTKWWPAAEIDRLIRAQKIIDGKTLIGFLTWKRYYSTANR
jgi:ADP-ribose pyrophosphatase